MLSTVQCDGVHMRRKRRCLSSALGVNSFIIVLAGFVVIAMFQAVQISRLGSRADTVLDDIIGLQSEQHEIYKKYGNYF